MSRPTRYRSLPRNLVPTPCGHEGYEVMKQEGGRERSDIGADVPHSLNAGDRREYQKRHQCDEHASDRIVDWLGHMFASLQTETLPQSERSFRHAVRPPPSP